MPSYGAGARRHRPLARPAERSTPFAPLLGRRITSRTRRWNPVLRRELVVARVVRRDGHDGARAVRRRGRSSRSRSASPRPVNGLIAYAPVKRPSFSAPSASRWTRSWLRIDVTHSSSAARSGCPSSRRGTAGCSGARIIAVAPKTVSGRVVKTRSCSPSFGTSKSRSAPDGPADPVPLHRPDLLGPLPELVEAGEEALGVVRDLQEPLLELALLHGALAALAGAPLGLLVREDRLAGGAPVHGPLLPVGEPLLEHPEEEPLVPAVVLRLARRDFLRPVVEDAPRRELLLHRRDVRERRLARRDAPLDREVLGGEPEGVPAHRAEDRSRPSAEVAVERVRQEVRPRVPDVEAVSRRVREHDEEVGPLRRRVVRVDEGGAGRRPSGPATSSRGRCVLRVRP